ncbi:MAG: hypothetical protein AAGU27_13315, partial [Dehalobacterium sp.]
MYAVWDVYIPGQIGKVHGEYVNLNLILIHGSKHSAAASEKRVYHTIGHDLVFAILLHGDGVFGAIFLGMRRINNELAGYIAVRRGGKCLLDYSHY